MFRPFRCAWQLLPFLLLCLLTPGYGQRTMSGPPTKDPFARPKAPEALPVSIGNYRSHTLQGGILTIKSTDGSTLRVRPWEEGVVRIEYFPAGQPVQDIPSVSVVQPQNPSLVRSCNPGCDGPPPAAVLAKQPDFCSGLLSYSDHLEWNLDCPGTLIIHKNPLRISYRQNGETLTAEAAGAFRRPATATAPGSAGVSLRLTPEEHLYGTGSRALPLDRRGRQLTLYNEAHYGYQNGEPTLNVSLPTVLSSQGYMLFFDNHTAGTLDLGATDKNVLTYQGEELTNLAYYLITGRSYAEILDRYTLLTGRQPLPPRWAMGLIQSRFGYKSEQEMYQVAGRMRRAGFPLDALVLDLYWFGGTAQQGDFQWLKPNFSNPARMMSRLDSAGVKTVLISEPYIMRTSLNDGLVRRQGLVGRDANGQPYTVESFWAGPATLLDMFKPQARQWMWQQYDRLKQDGVAGWWSDLGEPENQPADMIYDAGPTRRIHNAYGQAWAGILQEGYAQKHPEQRLFNLARSGWAGMQRNSVFPWSGDVSRSWSGLQAQVPIMLSMGLGGVGYMHSDAGGFAGNTVDAELYTRWLQMASLGPILRPHGAGTPPEPYWFPEPYQGFVRSATHLRYQLLPYLYSLAWENSQTGTPLTRPLSYGPANFILSPIPSYPPKIPSSTLTAEEKEAGFAPNAKDDDGEWGFSPDQKSWREWQPIDKYAPTLANVNDQFLLGPNLLVAPVLQPGQRRRNVVLSAGNWIDFYTHETIAGDRTVGRPAPLATIPLLVRAGAFLPMTRYVASTANYRPDTLQVRYYADAAAGATSFTMYDDDGHSAQAAKTGQYQLITFTGKTTTDGADIKVAASGNPYEGAPGQRVVELLIPRITTDPTSIQLNGALLPATGWDYNSATQTVLLRFPLELGKPVQIRIGGLKLNTTPAANLQPEFVTLEAPSNRTFTGSTELRYTLHQPGQAGVLRILNAQGELVRTLPIATEAGAHTVSWNSEDDQQQAVSGGIYWAELAGQHQRLVVMP
ncbi:TIM-barrel domain-containing protein [Hymenobacter tenuis]